MNLNLVRVVVLLDRSGSMKGLEDATVSGVNEFVNQLKVEPGEVNLKAVQFDTLGYDVIFDKPLKEVPLMTRSMFEPRGGTPYYDSLARTIRDLGKELSDTPEDRRPGKVVIMTMTDGLENSSQEFNRFQEGASRLAAMIKEQTEKYNWTFLYMGANQDAIAAAIDIGIAPGQAATYMANYNGTVNTYKNVGRAVNSMRSAARSGNVSYMSSFTEAERRSSMADDPTKTTTTPGGSRR